MQLRLPLSFKN